MRTHKRLVTLLGGLALLVVLLATHTSATLAAAPHAVTGVIDLTTHAEEGVTAAQLDEVVTQTLPNQLTADEADALRYMREEEKLAHDVYVALSATWGLPIFDRIATAESTHAEAVRRLLDRYGLEDPAAGAAEGVFANADLQVLYDQLVAEGNQSLTAALRVGATIEELDIVDLQERSAQTDQPDIHRVYLNLLRGSRNHLRAFTRTLVRQAGETYQPQYLDQAAYDAMVAGPIERGSSQRRGRAGS